ncbi:MAG: antibiotic biosynthesis monooxygenase [Chloroflexota bacterium]
MPFFVAVYQHLPPDRLQAALASMRSRYASSRTSAPGRQRFLVFQRLNEPASLLSVSEWASQASYESHDDSPTPPSSEGADDQPPAVEHLQLLHLFVRMNQCASVFACITVTAPAETAAQVEAYLRGDMQQRLVRAPGLASRELFQVHADQSLSARFLIVHGWCSITDLERFRAEDVPHIEAAFRRFGATYDRFTGQIAVEYSVLDGAGES